MIKHTVAVVAVLAASIALAGPASADVPEGWPEVPAIETLYVLGVMVGVPLLLFVVITVLVYLPGLMRGERVAPGATGPEDQWLGGRRDAGEIALTPSQTNDDEGADEAGGGASARW